MIAPKVTWHKMKCVVPVIKETLYYTIMPKTNLELAYFCEKSDFIISLDPGNMGIDT